MVDTSIKVVILVISNIMKQSGYVHQNHKFRVFRQSLQISQVYPKVYKLKILKVLRRSIYMCFRYISPLT